MQSEDEGAQAPACGRQRPQARHWGRWLASAPVALGLAGCSSALLDPQGAIGVEQKTILIDSMAIMLAIVVPTIAATLGFAWWFRASNTKAHYRPTWDYSGAVELVVWAIPLMVIILLGGVTWIGSHRLDPARPIDSKVPPLQVQVVSMDWKWLFIYPAQGVASVNRLVVPAGVPIQFTLTSASVMNTFFVPQLGSMIYTMNGMTSHLNLIADRPGTFHGLSGHFSGDGFSDMHFDVNAVSTDDFGAWVATQRSGPTKLDAATYALLTRQGTAPVTAYGQVEPKLFERIAKQEIAPGRGPGSEGAGPSTAFFNPRNSLICSAN